MALKSANKSMGTVVLSSGVSASQLVELVELGELAVALLDQQADSIRWCSAHWMLLFPQWAVSSVWSEVLSDSSELVQLYNALAQQSSASGSLLCQSTGKPCELIMQRLSDGTIAIRAIERSQTRDDMHLYMQARENMFTTSRTISVSEMATTLAHEIKQPIATISNILKGVKIRLKRDDQTLEQIEVALDNALDQARFTNSVINRIRDFTQARRPQQQQLSLVSLTREALSLMDWLLSANQCKTELLVSEEPLLCHGDPTMLQQVLVNLLRNGVEAMLECAPAKRRLIISCARRGASVRVSIRDSGHGLEGKEQSLFIPFATNKANGMGVGLNICRSFVELHQGRLWLSPNEDAGCTSHVELPMALPGASGSVKKAGDSGNRVAGIS
ncbi:sensor histidine kinase [Granulosicoccus antarcticus]|uniref:histidine kinase n=1 Tax=Granulosicoccus antarcticus IMCC3135 TaxID=1192854 RepID=A0A2Z2NH95_9GAMM|nr:sensor histidine kinase [Granulosicoccus antarcticus]ASJ70509.1 Sensor protein FixL [Granulosicoccus antarcticus IMCC3135]